IRSLPPRLTGVGYRCGLSRRTIRRALPSLVATVPGWFVTTLPRDFLVALHNLGRIAAPRPYSRQNACQQLTVMRAKGRDSALRLGDQGCWFIRDSGGPRGRAGQRRVDGGSLMGGGAQPARWVDLGRRWSRVLPAALIGCLIVGADAQGAP